LEKTKAIRDLKIALGRLLLRISIDEDDTSVPMGEDMDMAWATMERLRGI
jgi:hypothetical protein